MDLNNILRQAIGNTVGQDSLLTTPATPPVDYLEDANQSASPMDAMLISIRNEQINKAAQDKADLINTNSAKGEYGTAGNAVRASVQPNGVVSITNVGIKPTDSIQSISGVSKEESVTSNNIDEMIRGIQTATDSDTKTQLYGNLQAGVAAAKANMYATALESAKVASGVPELEAQLEQSRMMDKQDVNYQYYQRDSERTLQIARALESAKNDVNQTASQFLNSNVQLASMIAKAETASKLMQKQDAIEIQQANRQALKEDQKEFEKEQLVAQTPAFAINRARVLFGDAAGTTPEDLAQYIHKGTKSDDIKAAILAASSEIPEMAFIGGNATAKQILMAEEIGKTGKDKATVEKEVADVENLLKNPAVLKLEAKNIFGEDSEEFQAFANSNAVTLAGQGKEAQAQASRTKFAIVQSLMNKRATKQFFDGVASWGDVNNKELQTAITTVRSLDKPTNIENVIRQYVGTSVGELRIQKVKEFENIIKNASARAMQSSIANPNIYKIIGELPRYTAPSNLFENLTPKQPYGLDNIIDLRPYSEQLANPRK